MLVLQNLEALGSRINEARLFSRRPARLAQPEGAQYRFTSSGLKGEGAVFAQRLLSLEDESRRNRKRLPWPQLVEVASSGSGGGEEGVLAAGALVGCTHLVAAVGYTPSPLPPLLLDGRPPTELEARCCSPPGTPTSTYYSRCFARAGVT